MTIQVIDVRLGIISLFPEMFESLSFGMTGKAISQGQLELYYWNPRDFATDKHKTVDDRPYGGGPGMVMKIQPLADAIQAARKELSHAPVIHLSPQGKLLSQQSVNQLAKRPRLILVASRYEGIDERLLMSQVDEEWSIGDYVLSGGELPAMVLIDAIIRHIPGVLGHQDSAQQDSFMDGILDHPHFTRPDVYCGQEVPAVLLKGNHKAIAFWRLKQALGRTWLRRPDLLEKKVLTPVEEQLLNEFIREYQESRGKNA